MLLKLPTSGRCCELAVIDCASNITPITLLQVSHTPSVSDQLEMTAEICSTSKLNTLVTKLHEYLGHSSEEESSELQVPEISHGELSKVSCESNTTDQIMEEPGSSTDTVKPSSSRSKRKPAVVTKHTGLDESDISDQSENEGTASDNPSESKLDVNSLPKGTVVVKPEPVGNEAKDDFRGPEFRSRGSAKLKTDYMRKRGGEHLQGIVSCTACGQQVNHFQRDSFYQHPVLKVLICKSCFKFYSSDDISKDADGMDEQCRWCAEGGNLICCDFCNNAFCKKCILRNLGRKELSCIMDEESKWYCYVCSPEALQDLVAACDSVLQNLEQLWQRHRKRARDEHEKPGRDVGKHRHQQKSKATLNGKDHGSDGVGSSTLTISYKALKVPKELAKKTKKLIETTTSLNHTFIKFIQQASTDQGTSMVRLRHLKAFRSVLADLKVAHSALEESLEQEFKGVQLQNGEESGCDVSSGRQDLIPEEADDTGNHVKEGTKESNMNNLAGDAEDHCEEDGATDGEVDGVTDGEVDGATDGEVDGATDGELDGEVDRMATDGEVEGATDGEKDRTADGVAEGATDTVLDDVEMKERPAALPKEKRRSSGGQGARVKRAVSEKEVGGEEGSDCEGESSLDKEIVSVPLSVPDELFEMVDGTTDSSGAAERKSRAGGRARKSSRSTASLRKSPDSAKGPIKVTKNLVLKLTPVPLEQTPMPRSQSEGMGDELREDEGSKDEEEEGEEEEVKEEHGASDEEDGVTDMEGTLLQKEGPDNRRLPRLKTTPLRKQADGKSKPATAQVKSESDMDQDSPAKAKAPHVGKGRKADGEKGSGRNVASSSKADDSDSDEVPAVLLQTADMTASSDEADEDEDSASKAPPEKVRRRCLFQLQKSSTSSRDQAAHKRKVKVNPSDLDATTKTNKTANVKKQKGSDSSNYDSDLEKEIKSLSKLSTVKRGRRGAKKQAEEEQEGEGEEGEGEEEEEGEKREGERRKKREIAESGRGKEKGGRAEKEAEKPECATIVFLK
ncbi:hypothetical protein AAFF_G00281220 [Aldrovandia affinis]|uniref:DNA helicase n=1 Tax=Aldrovandia affinis TaxID=143900 RepID=A0AAD7RA35_9TELE|nr:hypothetical protein AAFF_G00281220 [Aldrovandia affinis]